MADWFSLSQNSGNGSADVVVSTQTEHTGRTARSAVLIFKSLNTSFTRMVYQAGKAEFVAMDSSKTVEKEGQTISINGESNSSILTFSLGQGDLEITIPETYIANGVIAYNGDIIQGDPGASNIFDFTLNISVPSNSGASQKTRQIIVTDNAGHRAMCDLILSGSEAYLRVTEGDINLNYNGNPVTIRVESNIDYVIENNAWQDDSGDILDINYSGSNSGDVVFSSDTNEGVDRSADVYFKGNGITVERTVNQDGKRETFYVTEGEFLVTEGNFNVIKYGIQ